MTQIEKPNLRRGALGKGISSLLGDLEAPSEGAPQSDASVNQPLEDDTRETRIRRIPVQDIDPNPKQPRRIFDESALSELAASIKVDGVIQPVIVSKKSDEGRYVLIAGERRWRASQKAGIKDIPAIVRDMASEDLLRIALIENIQRADLNVMEEAEAYNLLMKELGLTQEQCAEKVGKDRSTITNILRMLSLPREIQDDVSNGRLSMGHGRAILSLEDKKLMVRCRDIVIKKALSVRQTEQLVKTLKTPIVPGGQIKNNADLQYVTESLRSHLHTKVKISGNPSRGRIEISYFSTSELERILRVMGHQF